MTRRVSRVDLLASGGVFLLAFGLRALTVPTVLLGRDGAIFFGNDAYYHARRIWYSIVHFPDVLQRDPYMNFPEGGEPIWTPTLDWLTAAVLQLGSPSQEAMETWIVWVPPLLGACTVVVLYFLALRYFSRAVALVAAVLLAFMPAHFWYSQLGFVDHHVAVALITTALLAACMSVLSHEPGPDLRGRGFALGAALAASLWVWPGCLLHVGIVEAGLVLLVLFCNSSERAVAWGRLGLGVNVLAFFLVLPFAFGSEWERWGRFSPLVASEFQPLFFALMSLFFLALSEFWRRFSYPARIPGRAIHAGIFLAILSGLALLFFPVLSGGLDASWSWLVKGESFQAGVGESKALFQDGPRRAEEFFTRAIYLAPILLVFFWGRVHRRSDRAACLFLVAWSLVLAIAALMQLRFANSFAVAWSLLLGWSLVEFVSGTRARFGSRSRLGWGVLGLGALAMMFAVLPSLDSYRPYGLNLVRVLEGEAPRRNYVERLQLVRERMSDWIRNNTPPTTGWLDESAEPQYGILAPWSAGHVLKYVGRRPVVQDNFGDDAGVEGFETARRYFRSDNEAAALDQIDGMRIRYVVVRASENRKRANRFPGHMQTRLEKYRGSDRWMVAKGREEPPMHFEALEQHRLVYESAPLWRGLPDSPPLYQIFEIVPGATVEGSASPGEAVVATLELQTAGAKPLIYMNRVRTDEDGRWEMRLPYSNEKFSSAVAPDPLYQLRSGDQNATFRITEEQVRSGQAVSGPDLDGS